ncbi:MAG TPA: hypothetical protein VLH35_05895 [Candidatus Acidoferrales bacterium]|nr:hypothetical protein [Candidatus Acidoferrales bacterium]
MTGKVWTAQQEADLAALVAGNSGVDAIAAQLNKSPKAVITKCQRMGLQLESKGYVNTSVSIPKELPSVEETAKILAGALKASVKPGLSRVEVQRLQTVANIAKMYKELIVDYVHYREVENKLNMVVEQNAKLQQALKEIQSKTPSSTSQSVP